jgi:small subunit ribosomal protein S19e
LPTVYDVPADELIRRTAAYLRENVLEVSPHPLASLVKTSSQRENPPESADFWYVRCASILRKIYVGRFVGIDGLRKVYGGRWGGRGDVGKHRRRSGGAMIRACLKQLEAAGLVRTVDKRGRTLTEKAIALLDTLADEVLNDLVKEAPELKKYA